jgi:hypothetical protein
MKIGFSPPWPFKKKTFSKIFKEKNLCIRTILVFLN